MLKKLVLLFVDLNGIDRHCAGVGTNAGAGASAGDGAGVDASAG